MYERFTDRSRKVMQLANQAAQKLNHEYIGTEHILLGLLKEGAGVAVNVLRCMNVDLDAVRRDVENAVQAGPDVVTMGKLPQTPGAKNVVKFAMEEAVRLGHRYVGTEHILLGLVIEKEGVGGVALSSHGVTAEKVIEVITDLLKIEKIVPKEVAEPLKRTVNILLLRHIEETIAGLEKLRDELTA